MKKEINGSLIKYFIHTSWWKILSIFAIGAIALAYIAALKTKLKDHEIMHLFVTSSLVNGEFNEIYFKQFDEKDGIIELNNTSISLDDKRFSSAYKSSFGIDADLFVVSESFLNSEYDEIFEPSMYKFNEEEVNLIVSNYGAQVYKFKEYQIGFKIFDIEDKIYSNKFKFHTYYNLTENYYVFIDKTSTNLKTISHTGYNVCFQSLINLLKI